MATSEPLVINGCTADICYILAADWSEACTLHRLWLTLSDEEALKLAGVFVFGNVTEARAARAGRIDKKIYESRMREVS